MKKKLYKAVVLLSMMFIFSTSFILSGHRKLSQKQQVLMNKVYDALEEFDLEKTNNALENFLFLYDELLKTEAISSSGYNSLKGKINRVVRLHGYLLSRLRKLVSNNGDKVFTEYELTGNSSASYKAKDKTLNRVHILLEEFFEKKTVHALESFLSLYDELLSIEAKNYSSYKSLIYQVNEKVRRFGYTLSNLRNLRSSYIQAMVFRENNQLQREGLYSHNYLYSKYEDLSIEQQNLLLKVQLAYYDIETFLYNKDYNDVLSQVDQFNAYLHNFFNLYKDLLVTVEFNSNLYHCLKYIVGSVIESLNSYSLDELRKSYVSFLDDKVYLPTKDILQSKKRKRAGSVFSSSQNYRPLKQSRLSSRRNIKVGSSTDVPK